MNTKNSNGINIPEAREAMDQFKMEAARTVGVDLKKGYNGHLTSREAGSVGGQMVKNMAPIKKTSFERTDRNAVKHTFLASYRFHISI